MELNVLNRQVFNLMEEVRRAISDETKYFCYLFREGVDPYNQEKTIEKGYLFPGNTPIIYFSSSKNKEKYKNINLTFTENDGRLSLENNEANVENVISLIKTKIKNRGESLDDYFNSITLEDFHKTIKIIKEKYKLIKDDDNNSGFYLAVEPQDSTHYDDTVGTKEKKHPLNLILYGPPGTGKTYHTVNKALEIIDGTIGTHDINKFNQLKKEGRIVFTTFHQSMSYEDFIEGIKPKFDKRDNNLKYPIKPGIFKQLCYRAKNDKDNKYVLIIDEINRGNVANIFGELITLIEKDKRLGEKEQLTVKLPYSNEEFGVPSNLYIIGTMNTADRSVEALDTALRRRFSFEEMMPKYDLKELKKEVCYHNLSDILRTINSRIELLKDRDYLIGHSYFMKVNSEDDLKTVLLDKIIPLLQEYFYGDYEKILMVLGDGFVKEETPKVAFAGNRNYDSMPDKVYHIADNNKIDMTEALNEMNIQDRKEQKVGEAQDNTEEASTNLNNESGQNKQNNRL